MQKMMEAANIVPTRNSSRLTSMDRNTILVSVGLTGAAVELLIVYSLRYRRT